MITLNGTEISYAEGMTLAQALKILSLDPDSLTLFMIEDKIVSKNQLLEDGQDIKFMRIVSGG